MPINKFLRHSHRTIKKFQKKLAALNREDESPKEDATKELKKIQKKGPQEMKVFLSIDSVFKAAFAILAVVVLVYLIIFIKKILIIFLVALFLSAAFGPAVDRLQAKKIPRALGIIIMYLIVLGIIIFILTSLIPIVAEQITALAFSIRDMIHNLVNGTNSDSWIVNKLQPFVDQIWQNVDQAQVISTATETLRKIGSQLTNFAGNAIGAVLAVFHGIFNMLLVLIISFFMIVNKEHTNDFFHSLFPKRYSKYITIKTHEVSHRIGEWIRGQVLLAIAMGTLTFIVFALLGLHYALTLAMVSALAEFIPYLGPLITFGSAALIALNQDPVLLLWLFPAYAAIQFLEGNIMVPMIIGKSVGLNPVVILFALLSGATIGSQLGDGSFALGLLGMIIAVPVANIISIFVEDYTEKNK